MSVGDLMQFLIQITMSLVYKFLIVMVLFAIIDYAYQIWKNTQDLMMTKEEVKDESKNADVAPEVKSRQRQMRMKLMRRLMMQNVADADVVLTNPTHFAVALKYDPATMKAPKVIAKGQRLLALKIRELAKTHQIPIVENKPLARSLYKSTQVNQEVPAALYAAIAEILAAVYRLNPYKYRHRATASAA
jgi:flagellar biosynthetic protein FlhB